jgi:hypothetical protein
MTALTVKETVHGNPGERRVLPKGIRVIVVPATNLPADSKIKWWASPIFGYGALNNGWPKETADWAEAVGVGLEDGDIVFQPGDAG